MEINTYDVREQPRSHSTQYGNNPTAVQVPAIPTITVLLFECAMRITRSNHDHLFTSYAQTKHMSLFSLLKTRVFPVFTL